MTPGSGIEIWKSERTSSSIASNSWSVLSISSISRTTASSALIASSRGRSRRNSSPKMSPRVASHEALTVAARFGLDPEQLLAVVPLIERLRLIESLVALQAQATVVGPRDRLGELGLPDARRALDENRLAKPLGEKGDQRGGLVGQIAHLAETFADLGDGLRLQGNRLGDDKYRRMPRRLSCPTRSAPCVLLAIGFAIGWYGHRARNSWVVAFGIVVILAAIGLLQLAIATHNNGRRPASTWESSTISI